MAVEDKTLEQILDEYAKSFAEKIYNVENNDRDILMDVFGISPEMKRENRQYWGRELGKCWERLVVEIFRSTRDDFQPGLRVGQDEPCDLVVGKYAIDTKYRLGSGDSGTLKSFENTEGCSERKVTSQYCCSFGMIIFQPP